MKSDQSEKYYQLGLKLKTQEHYRNAILAFDQAIDFGPPAPPMYVARAEAYIALDNLANALNDLELALEIDSSYAPAYYARAWVFKTMNRIHDAVESCTLATSYDPNFMEAYERRAILYRQLKEHNRALDDWNTIIKRQPNNKFAYLNRGRAYFALGDTTNALSDFVLSVRNGLRTSMSIIWGKPASEVRGELDRIIVDSPDLTEAYLLRAMTYDYGPTNQLDKAIPDYDLVLERWSEDALVYFLRGRNLLKQTRLTYALNDTNRALQLAADNAEYLLQRGFILFRQGNYRDAVKDLTKGLEGMPNHPDARQIRKLIASIP